MGTQVISPPPTALQVVNAHDIYVKNLPPIKWYVGDVLHEGACLLSGDPKVGKSFLALQIAIAVAGSADIVCGSLRVGQHGRVLYLALDDGSERRIHDRLHQLTDDEDAVSNIDFVYQRNLPPLSKGFDAILDAYLAGQTYTLVVLDTLGAVLGSSTARADVYRADYGDGITFQKLAQSHGICLLILHHTNKGLAGDPRHKDPVNRASGSHGLTGAVDSALLLSPGDDGATQLFASPRDGEKVEYWLARLEDGSWQVDASRGGEPAKGPRIRPLNQERKAVMTALGSGPKGRDQIATELTLTPDTARKRLERMAEDGLLERLEDGRYQVKTAEAAPAPQLPI